MNGALSHQVVLTHVAISGMAHALRQRSSDMVAKLGAQCIITLLVHEQELFRCGAEAKHVFLFYSYLWLMHWLGVSQVLLLSLRVIVEIAY